MNTLRPHGNFSLYTSGVFLLSVTCYLQLHFTALCALCVVCVGIPVGRQAHIQVQIWRPEINKWSPLTVLWLNFMNLELTNWLELVASELLISHNSLTYIYPLHSHPTSLNAGVHSLCLHTWFIKHRFWDSKSDPCACVTTTGGTEPAPWLFSQPLVAVFERRRQLSSLFP